MPRTNWTNMAGYPLVLPPKVLVEAFNAYAQPLVERMNMGIHEMHQLGYLRDALIPRLFSGELRTHGVFHDL